VSEREREREKERKKERKRERKEREREREKHKRTNAHTHTHTPAYTQDAHTHTQHAHTHTTHTHAPAQVHKQTNKRRKRKTKTKKPRSCRDSKSDFGVQPPTCFLTLQGPPILIHKKGKYVSIMSISLQVGVLMHWCVWVSQDYQVTEKPLEKMSRVHLPWST
jgi:hypothetical protein